MLGWFTVELYGVKHIELGSMCSMDATQRKQSFGWLNMSPLGLLSSIGGDQLIPFQSPMA